MSAQEGQLTQKALVEAARIDYAAHLNAYSWMGFGPDQWGKMLSEEAMRRAFRDKYGCWPEVVLPAPESPTRLILVGPILGKGH